MPRDIPSQVTSWAGQVTNRPVELYQVFLDNGTLRFAASDDNFVFGGETYFAIGMSRGAIRTTSELEVDEFDLSIDNVNLQMADQIIVTDFIGRRVLIFLTDRSQQTSGSAFIRYDGRIDEPILDQSKLSVRIRSWLDGMGTMVPRRLFSSICNYQLYDTWCTVTRTDSINIGTGTAIGSSTNYTLVADYLGIHPAGWWAPIGTLWMETGSNTGQAREIIDHAPSSFSVEVRIPFPFAINSGELFKIERGCTKTVADCCSKFNNYINYGGFPTIPRAGLQIDMPSLGGGGGGGKK